MFKNASEKDKKALAVLAPLVVFCFITTICTRQIPEDTFAFFWFNLLIVTGGSLGLYWVWRLYREDEKK